MRDGVWLMASCRRKDCCHSFEKGDVLKHMSILIKISNHLGLILPGNLFYWNVSQLVPYFVAFYSSE